MNPIYDLNDIIKNMNKSHNKIKDTIKEIDEQFIKQKNNVDLSKYYRYLQKTNIITEYAYSTTIFIDNKYIPGILNWAYNLKYVIKTPYNLICLVQDKPYYEIDNSGNRFMKFPGLNENEINDIIKETETNDITKEFETSDENIILDMEDLCEDIEENVDTLKEIGDVSLPLENNLETIKLKKPNQVYFELYREARNKAKMAKKNAILAYLEAKNIKKTYLIENLNDSDSDFDAEIDEVSESELEDFD